MGYQVYAAETEEREMRNSSVKAIALGGMLAAVALIIMCLGGMIPLATFVCPMFATLTGLTVFRICGKKIAWCWYGVVALLSVLMAPDKEAAVVFAFLGYYPFVKPWFDKHRFGWILKLLMFNCAIGVMYFLLLKLFGMSELAGEYAELGLLGGAVMILLGNVTFFLLDRLITKLSWRSKK